MGQMSKASEENIEFVPFSVFLLTIKESAVYDNR